MILFITALLVIYIVVACFKYGQTRESESATKSFVTAILWPLLWLLTILFEKEK